MAALYHRQLEKAAAILRRIVAQDPGNTLARRDLGSVYVEQKQYDKARECLRKVLERAPDDYVTNFELGLSAARLGLIPEAIDRLQTACRLAPTADQCQRELDAARKQAKQ